MVSRTLDLLFFFSGPGLGALACGPWPGGLGLWTLAMGPWFRGPIRMDKQNISYILQDTVPLGPLPKKDIYAWNSVIFHFQMFFKVSKGRLTVQ